MDHMLYTAMSGAKQTLVAQAINNHNLANSNTVGFRTSLAQFRSMPVFGPGYPTRVYAMAEKPGVSHTPGAIQFTGRDLDLALQGDGWIAVQGRDGQEAYTRAGDLHIANNGLLATGAGHLVLGNAGPIAIPPSEKVEIATDGTITIRPLGSPADTLGAIDRIKLVNVPLESLEKGNDGLSRLRGGGAVAPHASVRIISGALEQSNVNSVESMVDMIALARQFELQVKLMHAAEEQATAAAQVMRLT
jgi:flagellar basal-body rod protein FlgF